MKKRRNKFITVIRNKIRKPCVNCVNYGWHMPQCAECDTKNNFKWFMLKK